MVGFERTPYGLRLTFSGGTAAQNVQDCISEGDAQFGRMPKGWRLLVDVREAPLMAQSDFETMSGYMARFSNPPVRIAMVVGSHTFAMQLSRLYRGVGAADRIRVFNATDAGGLSEAESFVA